MRPKNQCASFDSPVNDHLIMTQFKASNLLYRNKDQRECDWIQDHSVFHPQGVFDDHWSELSNTYPPTECSCDSWAWSERGTADELERHSCNERVRKNLPHWRDSYHTSPDIGALLSCSLLPAEHQDKPVASHWSNSHRLADDLGSLIGLEVQSSREYPKHRNWRW